MTSLAGRPNGSICIIFGAPAFAIDDDDDEEEEEAAVATATEGEPTV